MEVLLIIAAVAASNIVCFMVGAKVGQAVSKGEEVKLPTVNPLEAVREHNAKKEAEDLFHFGNLLCDFFYF